MRLSDRARALRPSATLAVTARARALKAQGVDVLGFGAGEPDFGTPPHIVEAARQALAQGVTRYEDTPGSPAARQAVVDYVNSRFGLEAAPGNVILSAGAKHSLYLAFMALLNPGDEVLLPSPYWVSYPEQVRLAGATIQVIPGAVERDFKITPDQLRGALSERSRILVLCSPSNPTGTSYSRAELEGLAQVILEHPHLTVFSDEIYERLIYGPEPFTSFASLSPEIRARTLIFNGLSKAYAMTGWRVGYAVGPREVIKAMSDLQGQMTSNITSFTMPALIAALTGPQEVVEEMRQQFALRAAAIHDRLLAMPGIRCPKPTGAFYVFPDVSEAAFGRLDPAGRRITSAQDFAESLLEHARVSVVPGEDFGGPAHVRLSFATSLEIIHQGMDRLEGYLRTLRLA